VYRTESPWFWRLFGLPSGRVLEATEDGIVFPTSGERFRWRDGVSLVLERGVLGRVQLTSMHSSACRTVGLTWPWKSATVAQRLAELRDAGLRRFLDEMADEVLLTGAALAMQLGRHYVAHRSAAEWIGVAQKARPFYPFTNAAWVTTELRPCLAALARLANWGRAVIDDANASFTSEEMARLACMPEYSALTAEQLKAIVTLEDATLIVASAGSGKTRVIENRVRYLVEERAVPEEQILVLAFNRSVAREVGERLVQSGLPHVTVRTFHAMGLSILSEVEERVVGLTPLADPDAGASLAKFVHRVLTELLEDRANGDVLAFLTTYLQPPVDESGLDARDASDRKAHEKDLLAPLGMNGRHVKSYGEYLIASFLFEHQVPFEYERQYPHTPGRHRPDFTLSPDLTPHPVVFLEYFGTDRAGQTRADIDRERYQETTKWKEETHARFGTTLLALYYYDLSEGGVEGFNALLAERLRGAGYELHRLAHAELSRELMAQRLPRLVSLLVTFLRLYKGSTLTLDDLTSRVEAERGSKMSHDRARMFVRVFECVLTAYERELATCGDTDFEDMIGRSAEAVAQGSWRSPFTHVLVDEFQDISPLRARFVRAFQTARARASIFAVGDDFQSIYRFAGSQIRLMTDFASTFGHHARLPLSWTHRFSSALAEATGRFILKNPGQLAKTVRGRSSAVEQPITLIRTDADSAAEGLSRALQLAQAASAALGGERTTLLLGRYRADEPAGMPALQRQFPALSLRFSTIHGAKGVEADIVILLNLTGGMRGFPARIQDDPLMQLILGDTDAYPDAEERRLLYVALTRARHRAIIVANDEPVSAFCRELSESEYGRWIEVVDLTAGAHETPCPKCRDGHLIPRVGKNGTFRGCTNYPHCLVARAAVGAGPSERQQ
jgi:DNA helicase-4